MPNIDAPLDEPPSAGSSSQPPPHSHRRDLQDLIGLPRSALLSFLQKHMQPRTPRSRVEAAQPASYPALAAFEPQRMWKWFTEYWRYRIGRRHPFLSYAGRDGSNGVYRMRGTDGEIRIALAGDWGTGTDEAAKVAEGIIAFGPHYAIHLGDIYYVGDPTEVGANFLGIPNPRFPYKPCKWPEGTEGAFALNGNHEMYARGFGYFDLILPKLGLRGSPRGQEASYFCLENEGWRIIALDTGYNSIGVPILENFIHPGCALPPALVDWLRTVVRPQADDPRGIVILSHHQYVSRFDHCYPKPARQLAEFFSRPVLWLWGHEHRLVIYREAAMEGGVTAHGRCIGHGGMPVELPKSVLHDFAAEFVDMRIYPNDENLAIGFNGFAKMTLSGNRLSLDYVDLKGTLVFSEVWTADRGELVRVSTEALSAVGSRQ
jgi:hypothetical protein